MSLENIRIRRLQQVKKSEVDPSTIQPSINEMSDGDERLVLAG